METNKIVFLICIAVQSCLLSYSRANHSATLQCHSPRTSAFKLFIISRRNQTGHWIAQVQMDHGAEEKEAGPWELEVDHRTEKCGNVESVHIETTLAGPAGDQSVSRRIPPDYELIPGLGYYKLHNTPKNWLEALKTCSMEGAHLLIINSDAEAKALVPLLSKHPKNLGAWKNHWSFLGIHDYFAEGHFVTIYSQPLSETGYNKWYSGQVDKTPNESCGVVHETAVLADAPCGEQLLFICEQELAA